jgi:2-(1,2-epoxy-1,2-dihydrophenyl)acetyl-CoA isomerase
VLLDFEGGVATLRLNRPDKGNAIDERMAADLAEAATQIAERPDVRAVLIAGNGPNFTVGGDLGLFAGTAREQLPNRLRRMIDSYHLAIERLTSIDAPVVAAVRGGAGGGRLGLMYVADIVVATEDARFAGLWRARPHRRRRQHLVPSAHGRDAARAGAVPAQSPPHAQEAVAFGLVSRQADHQVDSKPPPSPRNSPPARRAPSAPSAVCCASRSRRDCPISSTPKGTRSSSPATPTTRRKEFPPS